MATVELVKRELTANVVPFAPEYAKEALRTWCHREGLRYEEMLTIREIDEETLYIEAYYFVHGLPILSSDRTHFAQVDFEFKFQTPPPFELFGG